MKFQKTRPFWETWPGSTWLGHPPLMPAFCIFGQYNCSAVADDFSNSVSPRSGQYQHLYVLDLMLLMRGEGCRWTNMYTRAHSHVAKDVSTQIFLLILSKKPISRPLLRDGSGYQNGRFFGKLPKGWGVIFNPKVADFGPLYWAFFGGFPKKIATYFSENGGWGRFEFFPKIHLFW